MNDDQSAVYLENIRNRVQHRRNNMDHNQENNFYDGPMNIVCPHCGALRFQGEPLNCCQSGKVSLVALQDNYMKQILAEDGNFRKNIRNYNSAFAFASFGSNITPPSGRGPYCFRLQG